MTKLDASALPGSRSRKRNLFSHVVEELGGRIVAGAFGRDGVLPNEAELGAEFGASRSVIREAVKSLAAKGLLESKTRMGIRALPPIHWNLLDPEVLAWRYAAMPPAQFFAEIFEIRSMIEPEAAALAAERATEEEIAAVAAAYADMEAADIPGNPSAIDADLRFHHGLLHCARNDLLLQMGNLIGVGLLVSHKLSSDSFDVFLPMHKEVLDAVAARRPEVARAAMARLLTETRPFLQTHLPTRQPRRRARG
jgi:DNA-binding FadR family transcriptional regulator